jgi:hypothetical protein
LDVIMSMQIQLTQPAGLAALKRRSLLAASTSLLAALAMPRRTRAASGDAATIALAEYAAIWGIPLVRSGRYLALAKARGLSVNRFYLNQNLATPTSKLAGANVDTIYGFAWLDLSKGPVVVDLPDGGDRYYSIQFIDAYETILGYAGNSATSAGPGAYVIAGPGWHGALPKGAKRIDSPTSLVLALTRTLVKNAADLPAAQQLQASYTIGPLSTYPAGGQRGVVQADALNALPTLKLAGNGAAFFAELDALVRRYPPRGQEAVAFTPLAPLGLGQGFAAHTKLQPAELQQALDAALARVHAKHLGETNDGWHVNYHIRRFIADPVERASLNTVGPGAHIAEEALYFAAREDSSGAKLSGAHRYTITFPKGGLPPSKSFWGLILYGADTFLVDNPAHRYSINDRSENLIYEPDGSLRIVIQHDQPTAKVNWLPAPTGEFFLILRTYEPNESLLSGAYKVPPVQKVA